MTDISKDFEALCDKEFNLARQEAFKDLDREIATIKNRMASTGNLQSSSMARAVVDAVLARFDKVLIAFESSYIGEWADTDRNFPESDCTWLKAKVTEKLDPEVLEVKAQCNTALWERTISFAGFWQRAEVEARTRRNTIFEKIEILRLKKNQGAAPMPVPSHPASPPQGQSAPWDLMHPLVVKIARPRFESGHFADSVEAALKEVNDIVRQIVREQTGKEFDGADLMNRAFSVDKPIILLDDLTMATGKNIQVGYMQIFSGAMTGIRNPKAHANIQIDATRAIHFLFLASLLLFKIDERKR
jgi:uncharacterized protein (TIGR02391 family)